NGDGTFLFGPFYVGGAPGDVALADFNNDGRLDVAVANNFLPNDSTVEVRLGNGDGSFGAAVSYSDGKGAKALATADVNSDSVPDLLATDVGLAGVGVFLSTGDGTLQPVIDNPAGGSPAATAVGDLTGDGVADLAVANNLSGSGTVSLLPGIGGGAFQVV